MGLIGCGRAWLEAVGCSAVKGSSAMSGALLVTGRVEGSRATESDVIAVRLHERSRLSYCRFEDRYQAVPPQLSHQE